MINNKRRRFTKLSGIGSLVAMGGGTELFYPNTVQADEQNQILFSERNPNLTYSIARMGRKIVKPSRDIILNTPPIPENGAVLPVEILSNIKNTTRIFIVCEPNDWPVIADFKLENGAEPYISTRINVTVAYPCGIYTIRAIVHANGIAYGSDLREVIIFRSDCIYD